MSSYTIPNVIAEHPRGERIMDVYSHLLTERIVYLGTAIDPGVANTLIAQLLTWRRDSPDRRSTSTSTARAATSRRCSPSTTPCSTSRPPVATTCVGQAVGAGAVAARGRGARAAGGAAARPGRAAPAGRSAARAPIPDLILQADEVVRVRAEIEEVLSAHTGQTVETLRHDTDRDRIFTAQAARDYGLVDQILTDRS